MRFRRTASLLLAVSALGLLGACSAGIEPAPDQPTSFSGFSSAGFPAPGPAPVPGQITAAPAPPVAPSNAPRPERGAVPTEGPRPSETTPRPTGAEAPAPGS